MISSATCPFLQTAEALVDVGAGVVVVSRVVNHFCKRSFFFVFEKTIVFEKKICIDNYVNDH